MAKILRKSEEDHMAPVLSVFAASKIDITSELHSK